jgi:zinc transport system substrate-binding protein
MKKYIAGMVTLVMLFTSMFSGALLAEEKKVRVVTTIFPIYDWVREIVGDTGNVEITLLLDNGVDLHSYQPTAQDIMKVATCDAFMYVGGESDGWVKDALAESVNPDMVVVSLVDALGEDVRTEETVEGMQHEHEEDEDHEHEEDEDHGHEEDGHDHEAEVDEHVWLSLRNAEKLVAALAKALGEVAPDNAAAYAANAEAYVGRLAALDAEYAAARTNADFDTLLFGDRFPFRYLTEDYGLKYYAAFSGCSAESEASFETIAFLAGKVDELGLTTVLTIEGGQGGAANQVHQGVAETVVQNTRAKDAKVLVMDSMQGTTGADAQGGATYLGAMEKNLEVLKQALAK